MRTPLGTSIEPVTCAPKRPNCDHWVLGANHLIASASPTEEFSLGAAVPTDCGVLLSWERITAGPPWETLHQETTRLAPDGSRTNEPNHTTFLDGEGDRIWLAARGSRIAAMQGYCLFVPLDAHGANTSAVVQTADLYGQCGDLGATDDGFSFLTANATGELVSVDSAGALVARTALNVPSTRELWSRAMLDDGSFILYSFTFQHPAAPPGVQYTSWLRHFDSKGVPLADDVEIDATAAPLHVAQSGSGLLVAWQGSTLEALPTNRDGVPTGPRANVPLTGFHYEQSLVALPNGDVMALSLDGNFEVTAHQLAPTGTPRGPGLTLPFHSAPTFTPIMSPSGDLLIAYVDLNAHDVRVQSLTCLP